MAAFLGSHLVQIPTLQSLIDEMQAGLVVMWRQQKVCDVPFEEQSLPLRAFCAATGEAAGTTQETGLALDQAPMTPRDPASAIAPALTVIVVEPTLVDIWFAVSGLANSGFHITVAESFLEAKALIDRQPPAVLITDVRLREYNGLHLVLRGKAARPDMAAIVVSAVPDPVLQAEAERMKATFVLKPTTRQEFLAAVYRTLFRSPEDSAPIRPRFERRIAERRLVEKAISKAERRVAERRRRFGAAPTDTLLMN